MKLGDNLLALFVCGLRHGDATENLDPIGLGSPLNSGVKVMEAAFVCALRNSTEGGAAMGGLALGNCNTLSGVEGVDSTSVSTRARLLPVMAINSKKGKRNLI